MPCDEVGRETNNCPEFKLGKYYGGTSLKAMDDFEIESDDDDQSSSFDGRASTRSYFKSSGPMLSKSIPSRSFFSGNNTENFEDD